MSSTGVERSYALAEAIVIIGKKRLHFLDVEPVYDTLPDWQPPTHGLRDAVQLLPETRACISPIETR
jgi:hypothetical protein